MFERFTDRARRVIVLSQEEARMMNHNYTGTEHLLLGLLHEGEGVGARALEVLGISLEAVRERVEAVIGLGENPPSGYHLPYTPRAKKVLELSLREAQQINHSYIGTEHLLLGLIREGEGVAAQILVDLVTDLSRVRNQVLGILGKETSQQVPAPASLEPVRPLRQKEPRPDPREELRNRRARLMQQAAQTEKDLAALEEALGLSDEELKQLCRICLTKEFDVHAGIKLCQNCGTLAAM